MIDRLPFEFDDASRQRIGIGPREYTALLHAMGVRETPAQLFREAHNDLVDALAVMEELGQLSVSDTAAADLLATDAATHMEVLVPAAHTTVAGIADDPGTRFSSVPAGWPGGFAFLLAPLPGVDAPSVVFTDALGGEADPDPLTRAADGRLLRHVLGHEAYPGHHVHHLFHHTNSSESTKVGLLVHSLPIIHEAP